MMFPIIQIGPVALPVPGLLSILGLWLGIVLAERYASLHNIEAAQLYNLVFSALIAGIIGARLAYILRYPTIFAESPLSIFSRNLGLLDPWGGLFAAVVVGLVYGQRKNLPLWSTLDALTPVLMVFAVFLAFSHLATGAAFGSPTSSPLGIELWGERRHLTQIYEIITSTAILVILWPGRAWLQKLKPGGLFLSFLALSSIARLVVEAFRGDSVLLPGGFRLAQIAALILLMLSLWGLSRLIRFQPDPQVNSEPNPVVRLGRQ
jgi:prolipoprotein diacylglyceryltransferase